MPIFLTTHSAPGLSREEFAQNAKMVLEGQFAQFRHLYANMRSGFITSIYEAADQDALESEFERVGFPWDDIHQIDLEADTSVLRQIAGVA
jgi:hypothetical protein